MASEVGSAMIGQILMQSTGLTQGQLDEALKTQQETGELLGKILIEKSFLTPSELMKALCFQLEIPYLDDLAPELIDADLVKNVPINYAKSKEIIPLSRREDEGMLVWKVAASNPFDETILNDLEVILDGRIEIVVASSARIQDAINRVYERVTANIVDQIEGEFEDEYDLEGPIDILEATEDDAPVIRFVNSLLMRAIKEKASDIHIEPYEKEFVVRFRIDGVLDDVIRQPKGAHAAISSRIKVLGNLDIAEKRMPQDGRIKLKMAGKDIDLRLSTVPTLFGERVVMRILEKSGTILELEQLGFREDSRNRIERIIQSKYGIILVTGPTGSGKSTTLSALLLKVNSPERNILTVEDPIEYQIQGISQVQVNAKIDLTFAKALRHFLRQDPDIIMVGEIRDKETAEIAINASLTGHLVLSTIHTNDAAGSATRLIDMGVEPFMIASSLLGVVAQRLIRRLCNDCKQPYTASDFERQELGIKSSDRTPLTLYKAVGCPKCGNKGYQGRTVIHELMILDDEIRSLIIRKSDAGVIKKAAINKGMIPLREDGIFKVKSGITSIDELAHAIHAEEETQ